MTSSISDACYFFLIPLRNQRFSIILFSVLLLVQISVLSMIFLFLNRCSHWLGMQRYDSFLNCKTFFKNFLLFISNRNNMPLFHIII